METLTQQEYQQKLAKLQSAREWKQKQQAEFQLTKSKPNKAIKRNWLQIGLDFLTK